MYAGHATAAYSVQVNSLDVHVEHGLRQSASKTDFLVVREWACSMVAGYWRKIDDTSGWTNELHQARIE